MSTAIDKNKQNKIVEDLIRDLQSKDDKILTSALKRVRSKGSEAVLPYLFALTDADVAQPIKDDARAIILELKSTPAIDYLLKVLEGDNSAHRELALSAFWNSSYNAKEHIDKFAKAATRGSYMEALEAYTVIENLDGPFDEIVIIEAQLIMKQYFSENKEKDEKYDLLVSIVATLDKFEQSVMDE